MASRVTGAARPGTVLVSESVWEAISDAGNYAVSFAGACRLKGVKNEVKPFRIRRGTDGDGG